MVMMSVWPCKCLWVDCVSIRLILTIYELLNINVLKHNSYRRLYTTIGHIDNVISLNYLTLNSKKERKTVDEGVSGF